MDHKRKQSDLALELRTKANKHRDEAKVYKTFHTILPAFEFSVQNGKLPMYSLDKERVEGVKFNIGSKVFIVAGYDLFWKRYSTLEPTERCFYETLAPDVPSHPYFDLEFLRAKNPRADEAFLESNFKAEVIEELKVVAGISGPEDVEFMILDSSNEKKFSKHYILRVKDGLWMFKNNYHCGAFARRLKSRILKKYGQVTTENPFFVWGDLKLKEFEHDPERNLTFFADLGVYTLRRQMRLYGSTKREGGYRPLFLEGEDKTRRDVDRATFYKCIIQRVSSYDGLRIVECLEEDGSEPVSAGNKRKTRPAPGVTYGAMSFVQRGGSEGTKKPSDPLPPFSTRIGDHISSQWGGDCANDAVYYSRDSCTITFKSSGKNCRIYGAEHKSNHIKFKANLKRKVWWQECLDEGSCWEGGRSKKTQDWPLPESMRGEIEEFLRSNPRQKLLLASLSKHTGFYIHIPFKEV
jgi:hypothetical protein